MKKFLLIMFVFSAGNMFAQSTASASATINAEIVSPISIQGGGLIDFGRIASTKEGGEVYVSPAGTRTASVENLLIPGSATTAKFLVKAADGYAYSLAVKADPLTSGSGEGAHTMDVNFELAEYNLTGNGQEQEIGLTSTLVVNPAQAAGDYKGEVIMTVSYE